MSGVICSQSVAIEWQKGRREEGRGRQETADNKVYYVFFCHLVCVYFGLFYVANKYNKLFCTPERERERERTNGKNIYCNKTHIKCDF